MSRPEPGTSEYEVYRQQQRAGREARDSLLTVGSGSARHRSTSRRRDTSRHSSGSEGWGSNAGSPSKHSRRRERTSNGTVDEASHQRSRSRVRFEDPGPEERVTETNGENRGKSGSSRMEATASPTSGSKGVYTGDAPPSSYQPPPYNPTPNYAASNYAEPRYPGMPHTKPETNYAPYTAPPQNYDPQPSPSSNKATSYDGRPYYASAEPALVYPTAVNPNSYPSNYNPKPNTTSSSTTTPFSHHSKYSIDHSVSNSHTTSSSHNNNNPLSAYTESHYSSSATGVPGSATCISASNLPKSPNPFQFQTGGPSESAISGHYNRHSLGTYAGEQPTSRTSGSDSLNSHGVLQGKADERRHSDVYAVTAVSGASGGLYPVGYSGRSKHTPASGLTVSTGAALGAPGPFMPSPALQPYHGTYQSISPLPSPSFGPSSARTPSPVSVHSSQDTQLGRQRVEEFSLGPPAYPQSTGRSRSRGHRNRHSRAPSRAQSPSPPKEASYDPTPDAKALLSELKSTFSRPSPKPVISILPTLTAPELLELRAEYKILYRGVNLAKHLKSVFTTSTPFGKVVFAVALGPYESEAWFANSWYQKRETRNELLIESLMGRSNDEIARIKAAFRDAKYESSLENAVQEEIPNNKFRLAVMLQLAGHQREELDMEGIKDDVARLGNILERRQSGGETDMVEIIVNRSQAWIREVAITYRDVYDRDLMRAVIKRSQNLVVSSLPALPLMMY